MFHYNARALGRISVVVGILSTQILLQRQLQQWIPLAEQKKQK